MKRVTLRIPENHVERLDDHDDYPNRSEAIRAAVRELLEKDQRRRPNHQMWSKGKADD